MTPTVFHIAKLHTLIAIRSLGMTKQVEVEHGARKRMVETDHVARVRREVTFAETMQPDELFEIRYATRSGGYVRPLWEGAENLATSADVGRYEDYGTDCLFAFNPRRSGPGPYVFDVEVLNGFDPEHRDVHFHLGRNRRYDQLEYLLDLTESEGATSSTVQPALHIYPDDPAHGKLAELRKVTPATPFDVVQSGVWSWRLSDVTNAVVDMYWGSPTSPP